MLDRVSARMCVSVGHPELTGSLRDLGEKPPLSPTMVAKQIGRDAIQPGSNVSRLGVEPGSSLKRDGEHLRSEIVGQALADAAREVAVDGVEVSAKDLPESLWVFPRQLHDLVIGQEPFAVVSWFQEPGIACHYLLLSGTDCFLPEAGAR